MPPSMPFPPPCSKLLTTLILFLCALLPAEAQVITAIGDSITYGYGLSNPAQQSWTASLDGMLPSTYQVNNLGTNGATLQSNPVEGPNYAATNMNGVKYSISSTPGTDIVIIMLGTNDAKAVNQEGATAHFATDYQGLISEISALGNPQIFIATPPPVLAPSFGIDPSFVNTEVDAYVTALNGYKGVQVIDLNDTLMAQFEGNPALYLQADGIHPTEAGEAAIASAIYAVVVPEPGTTRMVMFAGCGFCLWHFARRKAFDLVRQRAA